MLKYWPGSVDASIYSHPEEAKLPTGLANELIAPANEIMRKCDGCWLRTFLDFELTLLHCSGEYCYHCHAHTTES